MAAEEEGPERQIQNSFDEITPSIQGENSSTETGEKYSLIRQVLALCTEKCFAPVRYEKIFSCLDDVRKKNPAAFDSVVPQLIEHLEVNVKKELELMFEQENLVTLCNQLDQLTKTSTNTEAAWRPSGVPSEDIEDHILHVKLEFRDQLRDKLKQLQDENKELENDLKSTGKEIADTEQNIIAKHSELLKISAACDKLTASSSDEDSKYSLGNIIRELKSK